MEDPCAPPYINPDAVVAWDIEVDKWPPSGLHWATVAPLGITCAAMASAQGDYNVSELWHGEITTGSPGGVVVNTETMERGLCDAMAERLFDHANDGYTIVTWNGLSFDFRVLWFEVSPSLRPRLARLAFSHNHVDMMFHVFCKKGWPVKLAKACEGMELPGKAEGMDGAKAADGWRDDPYRVLEYVQQDASATLGVYEAGNERKRFDWITGKGRKSGFVLKQGWQPTWLVGSLPLPKNDWMDRPMDRAEFSAWTRE